MRKLIPYTVLAGLVVAIVAGIWPKPVRVETAAIIRGPLTVSVFEEGKTRIRHRYVISSPVAGFLNRVELRPGVRIQSGKTVLATIEAQLSGFLDARALAEAEAHVKADLDMLPPTASPARTALPTAHFDRNKIHAISGTGH